MNPSRFQTHPAAPELFALCVIPAVFLRIRMHSADAMEGRIFIPASNEPSTVLARVFGECREGQIPRSSAALQVGCPVSLLRGI